MGKKKVVEKGVDLAELKGEISAPAVAAAKKGTPRRIEVGRIYINSSYNNTVITVTDDKGDVVAWASSGSTGFSGPKKATPFAASKVIAGVLEKISKTGPRKVDLYVSGVGPGRDSAIRTLASQDLDIVSIRDVTPVAHNGPKASKERRV